MSNIQRSSQITNGYQYCELNLIYQLYLLLMNYEVYKNHRLQQNNQKRSSKQQNSYQTYNYKRLNKRNIPLSNQYSNCFINASLQCLFNIRQFGEYFLNNYELKQTKLKTKMIDIAKQMWRQQKKISQSYEMCYNMSEFYQALTQSIELYEINRYRQMDASQFISRLLNYFIDNNQNKKTQKLHELFYGQFHTTITCKKFDNFDCNNISVDLKQSFNILPLTIYDQFQDKTIFNSKKYYWSYSSLWNQPQVNLLDRIKSFINKSKLQGQNKWFCRQCQCDTESEKQMKIQSIGKIFIIQLLRFSGYQKSHKLVKYPQILELSDLFDERKRDKEQYTFQLYGVVCHMGLTIRGGHYISYCLDQSSTQKWYKYSDSCISQARSNQHLDNPDAYLLFYKKVETKN